MILIAKNMMNRYTHGMSTSANNPATTQERAWLLQEKYNGNKTPAFDLDVLRLAEGEPLAYVIGWIPFYDCIIDVSLHPLIPRTETEFLLERAIKELRNKNAVTLRLADLFSGSGCIAVALLKHLPNATLDISEIDPSLLPQIAINLERNNIERTRAKYWTENALEGLTGTYDAIFANPPYIDPDTLPKMDTSVTQYEPHLALFAENHGLEYIQKIIEQGAEFLNTGGAFYVECDPHQRDDIERLLQGTPWKHEFWIDQFDNVRFLILRKS